MLITTTFFQCRFYYISTSASSPPVIQHALRLPIQLFTIQGIILCVWTSVQLKTTNYKFSKSLFVPPDEHWAKRIVAHLYLKSVHHWHVSALAPWSFSLFTDVQQTEKTVKSHLPLSQPNIKPARAVSGYMDEVIELKDSLIVPDYLHFLREAPLKTQRKTTITMKPIKTHPKTLSTRLIMTNQVAVAYKTIFATY